LVLIDSEDQMAINEGGCLCGGVRYATKADPMRVTYCHCRFCQRATGGAYLVEPIFQKYDFEVTSGSPARYGHVSEGSGKLVNVNFCPNCGTKLFLGFERFPDVIGVYGGTFDDPNWFPRDARISKHIFLDVAQHGTVIPAGIDTFRLHATDNDGTPIDPEVLSVPRTVISP
jgi:hypothetical protein